MKFPFYRQFDSTDCGPTCVRSVAKYYGRTLSSQAIRDKCQLSKTGMSLLALSHLAEEFGFKTNAVRLTSYQLFRQITLPCIIHWNENHYVIVYKATKSKVLVCDPARGLVSYSKDDFLKGWIPQYSESSQKGIVLMLTPQLGFSIEAGSESKSKFTFRSIVPYIFRYKRLLFQLGLGLLVSTLLSVVFPFFTQAVIDIGVSTKDIQFVYLILIGQLVLFLSSTFVEFVRSWILLHISTRVSLSLLSDYWLKLTKLPLSFFDGKMTGDMLQRIGDNKRIENFLTGSSISTLFSIVNFIVFTFLILTYDIRIFLTFLAGNVLYFGWVMLFLRQRRELDFKRFDTSSTNQSLSIQIIQGMTDIKISNSENQKRWEWESQQAKQFKLSIKTLFLNQTQQGGALFINQLKNIIVTFLSAKLVIDGHLTLGEMLAIQYIIGQLNSPVQQFIIFTQAYQDAKISLERVNEIHATEEEEPLDKSFVKFIPLKKDIYFRNISFNYGATDNSLTLDDINLTIPENKTTAIVGTSGSGKTTLLKLLLQFYLPTKGTIEIGDTKLSNISPKIWRRQCGVVMQDGFIFSDTIVGNISLGDQTPDWDKIFYAAKVANIQEFIESLPQSYNTRIGAGGKGLSQGQKQRILIARAIYKEPHYLFLDEATNALDSNNEQAIMENFYEFSTGRTVIIVAHRLSTVKRADQIIVLSKGKIVELGKHEDLLKLEGEYFRLVRKQIES